MGAESATRERDREIVSLVEATVQDNVQQIFTKIPRQIRHFSCSRLKFWPFGTSLEMSLLKICTPYTDKHHSSSVPPARMIC
jgi:hypothetical protein